MTMIRRIAFTVLFLFFSAMVLGQEKGDRKKISDIFSKSKKCYENAVEFKLNTEYKLFPTYKSTVVSEKYTGVVYRKTQNMYAKIDKTEFITAGNTNIKIDNESKLMQFDNEGGENTERPYDISNLLSNFEVFELTEDSTNYICTMTGPAITMVPYGKAIIYISKTDYSISRQILYLLTQGTYINSKGKQVNDFPRLEIIFSGFQTKNIDFGNKFEVSNYITKNKNKTLPSTRYKDYTIID